MPIRVQREPDPWERAAADPMHTDAEALYLALAYTTDLLALPVRVQAERLSWTPRKVYRIRASLIEKGWEL